MTTVNPPPPAGPRDPRAVRGQHIDGPLTRETVLCALRDVRWPARAPELLLAAHRCTPRADLLALLTGLPDGVYLGPNQVSRELFGPHGACELGP
ncbi:DUF2795 domain-containing protein [Yinghuangia soli]|uniref:DUF2795 domain-containing protein n=1 Tax=Yinghuangia soli TaxID=2908204 RepID=A0AA41PX60_9ACTN|nr:hypothetical protein [Yinghuangia soli]MCF2527197.1 hypothetical protein [Yinghuangia soli]